MSLHPTLKWAQRKQKIFLSLALRDITNQKINIKDNSLEFQCHSNSNNYEFKVEFFDQIDQEKSQWSKTGFQMIFVIVKKDSNKPYWPRLTKQNKKTQYIQCDWDKWIDQEDEQEEGQKGLGGFDYGNMNNFNDSDDEEETPAKNEDLKDLDQQESIEEQKPELKPETENVSS